MMIPLIAYADPIDASIAAQGTVEPVVSSENTPPPSLMVDVRVGRTPGRTRVVFDLSDSAQYQLDFQSNSARIVIEFEDARLVAAPAPSVFRATPVVSFRTDGTEGTSLRLVLDLDVRNDVRLEEFLVGPHGDKGHRLVVDLYEQEPAAQTLLDVAPKTAATPAGDERIGVASSDPTAPPANAQADPELQSESATDTAFTLGTDAETQTSAGLDIWTGGYGELSAAYTYPDEAHWSQLRARAELGVSGALGSGAKFRIVGRAQGDGAFSVEDNYYPSAVRRDQESEFVLREAYLDFSFKDWEYRLGKQHVVWGEMVGFFLADVVSARDTREFYLPEFESMRLGQWAVRAEYFSGDSHFELLWVPYVSYDEIGKPGADFYPYPLPPGTRVEEITPSRNKLSDTNFGARYSLLVSGWDLTAFYYQSNDVSPTLYLVGDEFELRHDRLDQFGSTFSKDYGTFILKGEAVYTSGRGLLTNDPLVPAGVEEGDSLDYIVGVMIPRGDWRFDLQFYGRHVFDYDRSMQFDADETGVTLLANRRFGDRFEVEVLYLGGLNRKDYSWQSSVTWHITQTWRLQVGVDTFGGSEIGYFGRYDSSDRVFVALRNWF